MALHPWSATLRELLFSPGSFFENRPSPNGSAGPATGVVVLVAAVHALVFVVGFSVAALRLAAMENATAGEAAGDVATTVLGAGLAAGVLVFVNWLLVSAVLHVGVKLRDGDGNYGDTLFVVGWSSPVAVLLPAAVVVAVLLGLSGPGPAAPVGGRVAALRGSAQGAGILASLVVLLWQGYIWQAGVESVHGLSGDDATLPVVVTVALGVVATLLGA